MVKNGCRVRGGIWHVAQREGGANAPTSARNVPPLLPAAGRICVVEEDRDEHGGKQVEQRGKGRQTDLKKKKHQ